jgi:nitroreductase
MTQATTSTSNRALTPQALLQQLRWRYAVKHFDPARKIAADDWKALEDALVLSPSSYGLQPWHFFVITDPATRAKLAPASWNQPQISECSHMVVFTIKKGLAKHHVEEFMERIAAVRGVTREALKGYENTIAGHLARPAEQFNADEWARKQVYLALGNFLTCAAVLGIDACPMEGIVPAQYDEVLGLGAKGLATVVVATAGYRAPNDAYAKNAKVRFESRDVITHIG